MMPEADYDAVIIGGGLGGLALSILLRRHGRSVLVVEKDEYPRHKVCGEYVSMESWPFLEALGLPLSKMELPQIGRLTVTDTQGRPLSMRLPLGGFGISRYALDGRLAELAQAVGVDVQMNCKADAVERVGELFRVKADANSYTARLVCGAWGKRSNIDIKLDRPFIKKSRSKLDQFIGIKHHMRLPFPGDLIALHNFDGGYCGVSPVEDNRVCICYLTTAGVLQSYRGDIAEMEVAVLRKNPALDKIFSEAEFLYDHPLAISQISFQQKEAVLDGVLMVGDTAGLITPLCGNGMSMAFRSVKLAAEIAEPFFKHEISRTEMEQRYAREWKRLFGFRLAVGRAVQSRFGNPRATARFLQLMKALPFLQKPLVRATHGRPFTV